MNLEEEIKLIKAVLILVGKYLCEELDAYAENEKADEITKALKKLEKGAGGNQWRQINFVLPECEFYLEDGSCKRANIDSNHCYSCNEMWCEKKIQLKERGAGGNLEDKVRIEFIKPTTDALPKIVLVKCPICKETYSLGSMLCNNCYMKNLSKINKEWKEQLISEVVKDWKRFSKWIDNQKNQLLMEESIIEEINKYIKEWQKK